MKTERDDLLERLDYQFREPRLLEEALTHRSVCDRNNERLEFLGDAILNFVIAAELFRRKPADTEGDLSRLRASLVNRESLADIARHLQLGECLRLGGGELKSGGRRRDSILSDALESVLGAVYLDGGFGVCEALIQALFHERLGNLPSANELKDPKTRLQEYLQSRRLPLPGYDVEEVSGKPHDQRFRVVCRIEGLEAVSAGVGGSRRRAEQDAARAMLVTLGGERGDNDAD